MNASHSVRADRAASSMEAFATMSSVEAFASMESHVGTRRHYTSTVEAAVFGMARPVVGAVTEVIVVVSFMMLRITTVAPIAKVVPTIVTIVAPVAKMVSTIVPPVGKVIPIAKVTKVSIKIMVEVAEEEKRRKAHVKR
jgi:hypothetical protein